MRRIDNRDFFEGFMASFEMIISLLDSYDSNELAKLSVYDFIELLREDLIKEYRLYKKDG